MAIFKIKLATSLLAENYARLRFVGGTMVSKKMSLVSIFAEYYKQYLYFMQVILIFVLLNLILEYFHRKGWGGAVPAGPSHIPGDGSTFGIRTTDMSKFSYNSTF